jgi:hypothetical protein
VCIKHTELRTKFYYTNSSALTEDSQISGGHCVGVSTGCVSSIRFRWPIAYTSTCRSNTVKIKKNFRITIGSTFRGNLYLKLSIPSIDTVIDSFGFFLSVNSMFSLKTNWMQIPVLSSNKSLDKLVGEQ